MKVFVDANILFSAAIEGSATESLLCATTSFGKIITNPHAWEEARRNLSLKRPHLNHALDRLADIVELTKAFSQTSSLKLPQQDIPIISGAIGARCTHLWTSDKRHFGKFYGKIVDDVRVVSSVMLANELRDRGWRP